MRPGFFVRFFASFFDLKAEHFPSFFTSTAAAEQPRRGHLGASGGPQGGSTELSGGAKERLGGLGRLLGPEATWGSQELLGSLGAASSCLLGPS